MAKFLKYKDQALRINFDHVYSYVLLKDDDEWYFLINGKAAWGFKSERNALICLNWLDEQLIAKDENEIIPEKSEL